MRFAVAVLAAPGYEHSGIFADVALSLDSALMSIGHDSVLTNRLDLDDRYTVVLQPHLLASYGVQPPRKAILYNLEPLAAPDNLQIKTHFATHALIPDLLDLFRHYPVWDYSQTNIDWLTGHERVPQPSYVPIGYVPELTRIAPAPEDIDVLFYGSVSDRRREILDRLSARGFRVETLFGAYGATRDSQIARSKIVLNIHSYEAQPLQIVRISYLLANQRAVVSETRADPAEERDLETGIAFADYDDLVDRCAELLGDEDARRGLAARGFQAFSARSEAEILRRTLASGIGPGIGPTGL
jgi:hypothetical protein